MSARAAFAPTVRIMLEASVAHARDVCTLVNDAASVFPHTANGSTDRGHGFGWFVGWATKHSRSVVFGYLIQDEKSEPIDAGLRTRVAFVRELPGFLTRSTEP